MAESHPTQLSGSKEDDNFERDLQEMLDDGPSLNEIGSTVQGGTPNSMSSSFSGSYGTTSAPDGASAPSQGRLTRSFTVPPGVFLLQH